MNVLIIGGCGYIGSAIGKHLQKIGSTADVVDLQWFSDPYTSTHKSEDYKDLSAKQLAKYDAIILVAAHSSVAMCQKDPYGAIQNNVGNFTNLIKKINKGQKFIYASSSCVYTGGQGPADEMTPLLPPCDYLTLTKQTIDHIARLSDVEFYGMRFGSVAGWSPNLRSDLMLNAMVLDGLSKGVVSVTNGTNYRPILSMYDLCRAVETILNCGEDRRGIYNLANFNVAISTVAQTAAIMTGAAIEVGQDTTSYDFRMDSSNFCRTFDFGFSNRLSSIVQSLIMMIQSTKACPTDYAKGRDVNKEYVRG